MGYDKVHCNCFALSYFIYCMSCVFKVYVRFFHCCYVRGRPFDSEGGGLALLVGTDYLFSSRARLENLFPGKSRTEYLFSTATNFLKSKKKFLKMGGGGVVRGLSRGSKTWLSMFCVTFWRQLACNIVYLVAGMFYIDFFSIYVYYRLD